MKRILLILTALCLWIGSSWGQTITIGTGTSTARYPLNDFYVYSRSQMLFLSSEITLTGTITHIRWYRSDVGADPNAIGTTEIWLMETASTTLSGTTWEGPGTLVATISNIDLGSGDGWFEVNIDDFVYSGTNNLLVSVRTQNAPYTTPHSTWRYTSTSASYRARLGNSDSVNPPTMALSYNRPNIQFDISTGDMSFASSTTEQASIIPVVIGSTNQEIVRLNVVTTGSQNPLSVSSVTFNTTGTTSTSDITAANVYYTTTSTFSTTTPFGSVVNNPSGSFTVNGSQTLSGGNNYFWLAYNISGSATELNVVDGQCTQFATSEAKITRIPDVTNPAGTRTIRGALAGIYTIDNLNPTAGTNFNNFTDAIDELNQLGISAAVTFNVTAGQTFDKTCPASPNNYAYAIETTGTETNPIIFQKSGVGANPLLNITGTSDIYDIGVFLYGTDYLTFNGIDINDAGTTSADYLDLGFYLQGPADNNCAYVTIKNSTIDLNRANTGSKGIYLYSNAPTSSANGNSYNTFLNNTIQDTYNGYYFSGNSTFQDMGNTIGIESAGTSTVQNVGNNLATTIYATYFSYQSNLSVSNTTIDNINGASSINGLYLTGCNGTNSITNNTVSNITGTSTGSTVYGIYNSPNSAAITNIYDNQIEGFNAKYTVYGIYIGAGSVNHVYKNTISNIAYTGTSTYIAYGLSSAGGTTNNIYNNYIYDIKAPASTGTPGTRALNLSGGTTANVFYNTVYIDYTSTVATNQSAALYITTSPGTLNMNNNIFVNKSDMTTGTRAAAFYKSSTSVANLPVTNNNNLFYAGTPGAKNLIFYNTVAYQTLAEFKTFIAPREQQSVTEDPSFISTAVPYDLHINTATPTPIESGGVRITTPAITTDFDADIRHGETGYVGTGTAPDIGADEFNGVGLDVVAPSISYTVLVNTTSTLNRTFGSVVITDPGSGVNTTPGTNPRVYYKKSTDLNDITGWAYVEANGASSPFDFTIDYSLLFDGSVSGGDIIQYFVVAQDLAGTPNVGINSGSFAAAPTSVDLTVGAFPIGGTINQYTIVEAVSGAKTVGTAGDYPTLTGVGGLFEAINSNVVTGNITATIISDITEPGTNALNQWAEEPASSNYTLSIQPDAATLRTLSGTYAGGLIRLNGADRVTIDGNYSGSGQYLLFSNDNTGTSNNTISLSNTANDNTIKNCILYSKYRAVYTTVADNTLIEGNDIYGDGAGNTNTYQAGVYIYTTSTNTKVRRNNIHDFYYTGTSGYGCYGIYFAGDATTVTEISNNVIYNIKGGGDPGQVYYNSAGIYLSTGGNVQIYYNSIYLEGDVLGAGSYNGYSSCISINTSITLLDIRNNALQNSMGRISGGTTSPTLYVIYSLSANSVFSNINYNDYYFTDQLDVTEYLGFLSSTQADLAAWQTASGQDANSLSTDPLFTTSTNLQPMASSPVIAAGTPIGGITTDYTGASRSGTTPSIGAYEVGVASASLDWANLQWPPTATITEGGSFVAYGQVYEPGVTDAAGQGAGIESWFGWNSTDTDPSTWSNWIAGSYNVDQGNNDEYMATIGTGITMGTYYYASRFRITGGNYQYGGYSAGGGGFWDGTTYTSGFLTVNPFTITTFPWLEGFEDAFPPIGWANTSWGWSTYGDPHTGVEFAYSNLSGSELRTPAIQIPGSGIYQFSFWYRAESATYPQDMNVLLSTDGVTYPVTISALVDVTNVTYQQVTFSLSGYVGQTIFVKFVGLYGTGGLDYGILVDDVEVINLQTNWAGTTDNDWNTAGNWSDGIPGSTSNVTIPAGLTNYPTLTSAGSCNNLTIESSAIGDGSLMGQSFLTVNGTTTIQRYTTPAVWHGISGPLDNDDFNSLYLGGSPEVWGYYYIESTNVYDYESDLATDMGDAKGWMVWIGGATPQTFNFTGDLRGGPVGPVALTNTGPDALHGYNFVGHPYSSAIDWNAASGWTKTNVDAGIWVWNPAITNWSTYNVTGGTNLGTQYIPVGQGFFVQVNAAQSSGTLEMTTAVQVHNNTSFMKSPGTTTADFIKLKLTDGTLYDESIIHLNSAATEGYDGQFDMHKKFSWNEAQPQLYSTANNFMAINSLPKETVMVPVDVRGLDGNEMTIALEEVTDFAQVYLSDEYTGIQTNLMEMPYTFIYEAGQTDRFTIYFTVVGTTENQLENIRVYSFDQKIRVIIPMELNAHVEVVNMLGQTVIETDAHLGTRDINMDHGGYYLVNITGDNQRVTRKVFIK
jgi:hypothetical protein